MGILMRSSLSRLAASVLGGFLFASAGSQPVLAAPAAVAPVVPTVVVAPGATAATWGLEGRVEAVRQATVAAQISGTVLQLAVKAGDRVRAGQLLARIDERDAAAALAQADAAGARAEAERQNAQITLERQRALLRQNFVSPSAVDQAETQFKAAQAGAQQAQSARSQAALARGHAAVMAPFDGVVQATLLEVGDLAAPGRPVALLYQPGALRAVVQVPASRTAQARQAAQTRVQLPDGRWITPLRRTELPATDAVSQTVEWRLDLPTDAQSRLAPGQSLRVDFEGPGAPAPAANKPGIPTLPSGAVLQRGELEAVYVAQGDRFVLRAVRLGATHATGEIEILAGLQPGERVALDAVQAGLLNARPKVTATAKAQP